MAIKWTRRQVLTGAALAAAAGAAGGFGRGLSALASVTVGPRGKRSGSDALVVLFLRGGADGLNIVVPYGDENYYRLRPTLALPRPNDTSASAKTRVIKLDDFFGLHPALAPLQSLHDSGVLAAIHAVGSWDKTRSHFEAMATMERGLAQSTGTASGWLARHLAATREETESPLRAVAIAETMPDSLRGATSATALRTLADFRLNASYTPPDNNGRKGIGRFRPGARAAAPKSNSTREAAFEESLHGLYGGDAKGAAAATTPDSIKTAGREILQAMDTVRNLDLAHYQPAPGVVYAADEVSQAFKQVAGLIKADVGLEVACLDMGGWDTHFGQGRDTGLQPSRLTDLGKALAAFAQDLGPLMSHVTTVVMTEFGRRAYENTSLGTDHGRASCMLLLGGGVVGGKVHTEWPGLTPDKLVDSGDLQVTTDYRDVLAEVVAKRLKNEKLPEVFPNFTPRFRNIVKVLG
jgi:uncharacterized protein (DUF1501 family)